MKALVLIIFVLGLVFAGWLLGIDPRDLEPEE
jgi:hypothetical protein